MATITQIPLSEYLEISYRPDREFIDGEIRERNVGKWEHARLQLLLGAWIHQHKREWSITGSTEQQVQVSGSRVRIPDVVILQAGCPPDVLTDRPLVVIEIFSPDDTYSDTPERAQDYRTMRRRNHLDHRPKNSHRPHVLRRCLERGRPPRSFRDFCLSRPPRDFRKNQFLIRFLFGFTSRKTLEY